MAVNRKELQQLAKERLADAKALLAARRWSGAYYLAGYAVECGLKACVIVRLRNTDDFPERRFSEQCWTHDLGQLLRLTGLTSTFDADAAANPYLLLNWTTAQDWDESSRYERWTKKEALELYKSIADTKNGVFTWIKSHW